MSENNNISTTEKAKKTHNEVSNQQRKSLHTSADSTQAQLTSLADSFLLNGAISTLAIQMPLHERSQKRQRLIQLRKHQNLEKIIKKSFAYSSNEQAAPKPDLDWFDQFSLLAENISNERMQELWSKILAIEVENPGSFSIKTLKAFREMNISTAKIFAKACHIAIRDISGKNVRVLVGCYHVPDIFNFWQKTREQRLNISNFGFSYADMLSLSESGLIFKEETESQQLIKGEELRVNFNGQVLTLRTVKNHTVLSFYKFTSIGNELAKLITDNGDHNYLEALKSQFSQHFVIHE